MAKQQAFTIPDNKAKRASREANPLQSASGEGEVIRELSASQATAEKPTAKRAHRASSRYCNPYTTTQLEKVGRYTCPLAIVGAANFA